MLGFKQHRSESIGLHRTGSHIYNKSTIHPQRASNVSVYSLLCFSGYLWRSHTDLFPHRSRVRFERDNMRAAGHGNDSCMLDDQRGFHRLRLFQTLQTKYLPERALSNHGAPCFIYRFLRFESVLPANRNVHHFLAGLL